MASKINYQKKLEEILDEIGTDSGMRLLLHSCCAPCSSYVLEYLSDYFEITDLYYNPNITSKEEYLKRERELETLIGRMPFRHPVRLLKGEYDPARFLDAVRGMEEIQEGGERCFVCYEMRMREAARLAAEGGFDFFTTTLSISPLKNADLLNDIGQAAGAAYGVPFLPSDFKKKDGFLRSIQLSEQFDLYRQDYCGCIYSKAERNCAKCVATQRRATHLLRGCGENMIQV